MKKLLPGWKAAPLGVKMVMIIISPVVLVFCAPFALPAFIGWCIRWIEQILTGEEPSDGGRGL